MHRSGTSAITRVLNLLGCDLPKTLMSAAPTNETGHWESDAVYNLNNRILESAGSNWHDWQELNPGWFRSPKAEEFRDEALATLEAEFGSSRLFVLKDPRICRLVPFWLDVLAQAGVRPLVLSPVRNPLEVAASLQNRSGFEASLGHLLWLRHVLDAEFASRGTARFFTGYDQLLSGWGRIAEDAQTTFGIHWPRLSARSAEEIDKFLSGRHRHHTEPRERVVDNPALSRWLRESFTVLSHWAQSGEKLQDQVTLDRIRQEFNAAAPAFGRLVASGQRAADKAKKFEQGLAETTNKLTRSDQELAAARQRATESDGKLAALRSEYDSLVAAGRQAADNARKFEEALAETKTKLVVSERELAAARQRVTESDGKLAALRLEYDARATAVAAETKIKLARSDNELAVARQRVAESDGKLAALRSEYDARATAVAAETKTKLARSENELAMAHRRIAEGDRKLAALRTDYDGLATLTAEAKADLIQIRHRLAETQSALAQRQLETEETSADLAAAREELRQTVTALAESDKIVSGLSEHVTLLLSDAKDRSRREESMSTAARKAAEAQRARFEEIAMLTPLLQKKEAEAAASLAELTRLRQEMEAERTAAGLEFNRAVLEFGRAVLAMIELPAPWDLLPARYRLKRQMALLKRSGLFDAEWYVGRYEDIAKSGVDPLRHYIEHGAREGREPNGTLGRSRSITATEENPGSGQLTGAHGAASQTPTERG